MMKNLTKIFLSSAPSRFKLPFGINNNLILKVASNEVRRDKNSVKINKNCYITFAKTEDGDKTKVEAESTFSYFNIDPLKPQFANKNFIHQFNQLLEIVKAVVPKESLPEVIKELQKVLAEDVEIFVAIKKSPVADVKLTKKVVALQEKIVNKFVELIEPFTGEKSDLVNLIVVTGPKGTFLDLPREDKGFIAKAEGNKKLTLDSKYVRWFENKDKKEKDKADDIGDDEVMDEEEIIVDDQDLDDI